MSQTGLCCLTLQLAVKTPSWSRQLRAYENSEPRTMANLQSCSSLAVVKVEFQGHKIKASVDFRGVYVTKANIW